MNRRRNSLDNLVHEILEFRDRRDWKQFHTFKDMALSLTIEASELAEHFQWKKDAECISHVKENREALGDELSDVLYWTLLLAHEAGIDLQKAFYRKMKKNRRKYPVKKAKGRATKYNRL